MKVNPIPSGYNRVMPYLTIPRAGEFVDFVKTVFDAQEKRRMGPPNGPIMHGEVKIGDSVIMFSDASEDNPAESALLMIYVENVDETYKRAIAAGAKSRGEPKNQFYGDRIAKIEDSFGVHWAISSRFEDLTDEELRKRAGNTDGILNFWFFRRLGTIGGVQVWSREIKFGTAISCSTAHVFLNIRENPSGVLASRESSLFRPRASGHYGFSRWTIGWTEADQP